MIGGLNGLLLTAIVMAFVPDMSPWWLLGGFAIGLIIELMIRVGGSGNCCDAGSAVPDAFSGFGDWGDSSSGGDSGGGGDGGGGGGD